MHMCCWGLSGPESLGAWSRALQQARNTQNQNTSWGSESVQHQPSCLPPPRSPSPCGTEASLPTADPLVADARQALCLLMLATERVVRAPGSCRCGCSPLSALRVRGQREGRGALEIWAEFLPWMALGKDEGGALTLSVRPRCRATSPEGLSLPLGQNSRGGKGAAALRDEASALDGLAAQQAGTFAVVGVALMLTRAPRLLGEALRLEPLWMISSPWGAASLGEPPPGQTQPHPHTPGLHILAEAVVALREGSDTLGLAWMMLGPWPWAPRQGPGASGKSRPQSHRLHSGFRSRLRAAGEWMLSW